MADPNSTFLSLMGGILLPILVIALAATGLPVEVAALASVLTFGFALYCAWQVWESPRLLSGRALTVLGYLLSVTALLVGHGIPASAPATLLVLWGGYLVYRGLRRATGDIANELATHR